VSRADDGQQRAAIKSSELIEEFFIGINLFTNDPVARQFVRLRHTKTVSEACTPTELVSLHSFLFIICYLRVYSNLFLTFSREQFNARLRMLEKGGRRSLCVNISIHFFGYELQLGNGVAAFPRDTLSRRRPARPHERGCGGRAPRCPAVLITYGKQTSFCSGVSG
jgi:hypothetical protein